MRFGCSHRPWRSHCIARCVRRAWLWGYDEYAGKDYSHRKQWVIERLQQLCSVFPIEVCAYAVMSNHYHLVLHVDSERARKWSREEFIERWTVLFGAPNLVKRWLRGEAIEAERQTGEHIIRRWRTRLVDISWFMRCLNEHLARRANIEDQCTGRFWEGRFKSQALLDEASLDWAGIWEGALFQHTTSYHFEMIGCPASCPASRPHRRRSSCTVGGKH